MPRITKDPNENLNKNEINSDISAGKQKKSLNIFNNKEIKKKSPRSSVSKTTSVKKTINNKKESKISNKKDSKITDKKALKITEKKELKIAEKKDLKVIDKKDSKIINKNSVESKSKNSKVLSVIDTIKSLITKPKVNNTEYYDLPYNYNETMVKILAQTPKKLFVYWDVSLKDIEKFKAIFGDDFFDTTYPVLIIHNEDKNYSFEIAVNDFANSWYINIDDPKCKYSVEYGRKFKSKINIINNKSISKTDVNLQNDYLFISNSNKIESPNDHILFEKYNYSTPIKYKNVKTQEISYKNLNNLPLSKNYPYNSKLGISDIYNEIYDLDGKKMEVLFNLSNPSSGGNPSSGNPSSQNK